jgi:hypothetical protein
MLIPLSDLPAGVIGFEAVGQIAAKRIALVTDLDWMITVTSLFGWTTPGELKRFPLAERDRAVARVAGGAG